MQLRIPATLWLMTATIRGCVRIDDGYTSADVRKALWMAADLPGGIEPITRL